MERQEKSNMEIFGTSIRHRTGLPKSQSPSETGSLNINSTSPARTLQQAQTEEDNAAARQSELLYERRGPNEREIDRLSGRFSDQINQPSEAQNDSEDESDVIITSHKTSTDNATTQQTKAVKFPEFVKQCCEFLPEVSKPDRKIELGEKVLLTVLVLLIFMVCCQMPLFGIKSSESIDLFYHMRVTRASNRGTPMEFGIMPIAESQFTLLILTGFQKNNEHDTPNNRALLNGVQKLLALLLTVVLSVLFIMSGMYGELEQIGVTFCLLISLQLLIAGLIILLLNGLVKKGYCLGTEISLFIVANICGTITWKAFSPVTVYTDQGAEFEGAFVYLTQLLSTKKDMMFILRRAFLRQNLPNLMDFLTTCILFVTVIYLKGFRVDLPIKSTKNRGQRSVYPVNLLYTSVAPLFLQSTFVPMFNLFSQVLSAKFNENVFVNLLGVWTDVKSDGYPRSYPIGGLCYYLSPPKTTLQVTQDPVYALVYTVFMIGSCGLFSRIWIDLIMIRPVDVAKELKDKNMVMLGHREQSMIFELERYIPTAATVGGICIGTLSVLADFLGVYGSGTGVIMVAIFIYDYAELFFKEQDVNEQRPTLLF